MINLILDSELSRRFDIEHFSTVVAGPKRRKARVALSALLQFVRRLLARPVSVVYVHVGGDVSLYRKSVFILVARVLGKCVLVHYHAGHFESYYHSRSRLGRWYLRRVLQSSQRLLVVSHCLRETMLRILPDVQVRVLHNAVHQAALVNGEARADTDRLRILFMGDLSASKGVHDLLAAMPRIVARAPQVRFLLCGKGDVRSIRRYCQRRGLRPFIEYIGPVPLSERGKILRRAQVFVLPSYEEGLPVSLLEAMAVGLPVVSTPVGGIPEAIIDGVNGFLIPPGDVESLTERLLALVADPALRYRMARANRERIAREFDVSQFIARLADHLEVVMDSPRHSGSGVQREEASLSASPSRGMGTRRAY